MSSNDQELTEWAQFALVAAVAASHMSMPNHWLPYSLVARAHGWTLRRTLALTLLGALGHVTTTTCVIVAISGVSGAVLSHGTYTALCSGVLFALGGYYLLSYIQGRREASCCNREEASGNVEEDKGLSSSSETANVSNAAAVSLVTLTTLSPCVGSMPVLATLLAPPVKIVTVVMAWLALYLVASAVMVPLVVASFVGTRAVSVARVRRHERLLMGLALIILAATTLLISPRHTAHSHSQSVAHAHDLNENLTTHDVSHAYHPQVAHGNMHVVIAKKRTIFGSSSNITSTTSTEE